VLSNKTKNHQLVLLHAIFRRPVKVDGLPRNPLNNVDRYRVRASGDIEVFSPEEIWALVRAATSEADSAIFLTAAFTGLREASCWDSDGETSTLEPRRSAYEPATPPAS
jgi:integrase